MKLSYLVKGFPGHPLHPPLTDATIGIYTFATIAGVLSALGVAEENMAAIFGHDRYADGVAEGGPLLLTLIGFGLLTLGGWLGGSVVYVHGMRVLGLLEEPTRRAVTPGHPEKEATAAGDHGSTDDPREGRGRRPNDP